MRKQLVSGKKLLLFVDTGDNCRCPLAIGYLTKLLQQKNIDYVELKHMGVMTPNDLLPTPEVVQLLKEEGIDIKYHRSRPVNDDLIRQADLVLGFTAIHVQTCLRRVPESKPKTFLLKDYVGLAHTGDQIHDPMGSTMEIFKKYFSEIKQSLQKLVEMEFIADPPEPKEVVILPTIIKPRKTDDDEELPAGYYDEQELAEKKAKAAKAKRIMKTEVLEDHQEPQEKAAAKAGRKAAGEKSAKIAKKTLDVEKPAKAAKKEPKASTDKKSSIGSTEKAEKPKVDKKAKGIKEVKTVPAKKPAVKAAAKASAVKTKPTKEKTAIKTKTATGSKSRK